MNICIITKSQNSIAVETFNSRDNFSRDDSRDIRFTITCMISASQNYCPGALGVTGKKLNIKKKVLIVWNNTVTWQTSNPRSDVDWVTSVLGLAFQSCWQGWAKILNPGPGLKTCRLITNCIHKNFILNQGWNSPPLMEPDKQSEIENLLYICILVLCLEIANLVRRSCVIQLGVFIVLLILWPFFSFRSISSYEKL